MVGTPMTNKIYNLNKTNIKDGVQCIKKLWFNFHEPIKIRDSAEFHKGDRFGLIVRKNYGDGLDLSGNFNIKEVVSKTEKALKSKNINVIYEGAFIFKKTLVRTDVLIKNKDGWDLLEAKATTSIEEKKDILKTEYLLDLSIQTFILKKCGVNLKNIKLIYINKEFIYNGDNKYSDLTLEEIVTDEIPLKEKEVPNYIKMLEPLINKKNSSPNIEMGPHCKKPHKCNYENNCKDLLPKIDIVPYTILPYVSVDKKITEYFKNKKNKDLQDVPEEFLFKNRKGYAENFYKIIKEAHKKNKPWFSENLKNIFKDYTWPYYFIDFETAMQGVPIIKGTQPSYPLPFQWSVHKWDSIKEEIQLKEAKSFLDFEDQNIERNFIESLLDATANKGTVFAHSASVEISVLQKLLKKENLKDLSDKIIKLINRVVDTKKIVTENFYSPLMNGSSSIKEVVKSIPGDIVYDKDDSIAGGADAMLAWFIYTDPKTSKEEKKKLKENLIKYCSKDTFAIYHLIKYLLDQKSIN